MLPQFPFPRLRLDLLGAAKWPDIAIKAYVPDVVPWFFFEEFGNIEPIVAGWYKKGCRVIGINGVWNGTHNYSSANRKRAVEIAKILRGWRKKYPGLNFFFAPFCEHNDKKAATLKLFGEIEAVAPELCLVNSVWKGDFVDGTKFVNEIHSDTRKPPAGMYFVSMDGVGVTDPAGRPIGMGPVDLEYEDIKKRYAGAAMFGGWILILNCNEQEQPKIDPKKRKAKPEVEDIRGELRRIQPLGPRPTVPGAIPLKDGRKRLWKPCAEDNCDVNIGKPGDPRARKPVLIMPEGGVGKIITLETIKGDKLLSSSKGATYSEGGYRYYFAKFGSEIARMASNKSGSEWVVVRVDGKKIGPVHPVSREGYFRR